MTINTLPRTTNPDDDIELAKALSIAEFGRPAARPNPVVGARLVAADGTLLASGHHARYGDMHAERACLDDFSGDIPPDATLYVSLEPCSHHGKQPPCSDLIIERGVKRVVIAAHDHNPETAGRGVTQLLKESITVEIGGELVENQAVQQNAGFHSMHVRGRPYVTGKWAITTNGKVTTGTSDQRWISSQASREFVHYLRAGSGAVLVGVGTVIADDPQLTVRGELADRILSQPIRVIIDRQLRTPLDARIVTSAGEQQTVIVCGHDTSPDNQRALEAAGVVIIRSSKKVEPVVSALQYLGNEGVNDVLCESGPTLATAMFDLGLIDATITFVAPFMVDNDLAGFDLQSPLMQLALAGDPMPSGVDDRYIAVINSPLKK